MRYPEHVARVSPTLEGFRAALRRPSFTLAEIAWRWAVGGAVLAVFAFGVIEYLKTLPVTNRDLFLLRTRHPVLVGQAIGHIFRGSLSRASMAALLAALALTFLWIVAASAGRLVTVRSLLDYFRSVVFKAAEDDAESESHPGKRSRTSALLGLNFLRAAVALAALFAFQGAAILAGFASPDANPRPGLAFLLFLPLAGLICLAWWALNWLLSLAPLFAVRDGEDTLAAVSSAVTLSRERGGAVFAVSTWTGLAHLTVFMIATSVVSMPLAFVQILPGRLVLAGVLLITLVYLAIADWLYMARLAGYVCIIEMPETLPEPAPLPPAARPAPAVQSTIDRDEPILSDVPLATS